MLKSRAFPLANQGGLYRIPLPRYKLLDEDVGHRVQRQLRRCHFDLLAADEESAGHVCAQRPAIPNRLAPHGLGQLNCNGQWRSVLIHYSTHSAVNFHHFLGTLAASNRDYLAGRVGEAENWFLALISKWSGSVHGLPVRSLASKRTMVPVSRSFSRVKRR